MDSPILILITSQDWGGAQLYVFELAKELKLRGEDVIVAAGTPSKTLPYRGEATEGGIGCCVGRELGDKCRAAGIEFIELRHTARDINPVANLRAIYELIKLFRKLKPKIVHLNSTMMGVTGSLAATLARVPKRIYCIGGWVFNEDLPGWKKTLYIWIERISARWKDVIITVHPGDETLARKLKIKPQNKIITIPNGINAKDFEKQLLSKEQARKILGIHPEAVIVGTIANAYPPKNLLWYLDVCKKINESDKRIKFVIIGEGPLFEALKQKRDAMGADEYVLLTGRRMDAPQLYRAFDIFVLPSSKEGMSITLLEAMTAKVPIIATDVGAARWMLQDGAILVDPKDSDAMHKAVLRLALQNEFKKSISSRAYEMLLQNYTWDKTIAATIHELSKN